MKQVIKKSVFPLLVIIHIIIRFVFSDTMGFSNQDLVSVSEQTPNQALVEKESNTENNDPLPNEQEAVLVAYVKK